MDCVAGSRDSTGFCVYAVNYSNTWLAFVSALQLREGDFGLTRITRQAYLGFHGARKPGRFALVARNEGGGGRKLSVRELIPQVSVDYRAVGWDLFGAAQCGRGLVIAPHKNGVGPL